MSSAIPVLRFLLPAMVLTACAPVPTAPTPTRVRLTQITPAEMLALHNRERASFGSPPLGWDPALAAGAVGFANELAREGRLRHSPRYQRVGQGENLWIGTRGAFPAETMVGGWTGERRYFRPGPFPHNSRTGRWSDVGHYTAMVWPATTRVGCALGRSDRWEVLVCRYRPSGNVDGVMLGRR